MMWCLVRLVTVCPWPGPQLGRTMESTGPGPGPGHSSVAAGPAPVLFINSFRAGQTAGCAANGSILGVTHAGRLPCFRVTKLRPAAAGR